MSRPTTAARRYAEAAFALAQSADATDRWRDEIALAATVGSDERAARVLGSPVVPLAQRREVLGRLLGARVSPAVANLVNLLMTRGRIELLPKVSAEFDRLVDRSRGIVVATVRSALPLSVPETDALRERVQAMTGAHVRLETVVDPALIGGLTVQVGDRLLDASVRGRLERLRTTLVVRSHG